MSAVVYTIHAGDELTLLLYRSFGILHFVSTMWGAHGASGDRETHNEVDAAWGGLEPPHTNPSRGQGLTQSTPPSSGPAQVLATPPPLREAEEHPALPARCIQMHGLGEGC